MSKLSTSYGSYREDDPFIGIASSITGSGQRFTDGSVGGQGSNFPKPRICLMGLHRAGKTSISKVVFHKMSPHDSLLLESTSKTIKNEISNSAFLQLEIWDYPGRIPITDSDAADFAACHALVFVIDAQDDYSEALQRLVTTVKRAYRVNPKITFEVFIHKVDGLSDDHKIECQRDIRAKATEELADAKLDAVFLSLYLTSIYDHSIFEAFSKVVQKLVPELPMLESLLDILTSNCRIEKAFLFDVVSKIYTATDSSPVDMQSYELCSDMIDVAIDVSCIYGAKEDAEGLAYDAESASIIRLNNGMALYLREVGRYQALVCILREENMERQGLLEYNIQCFRTALNNVADARLLANPLTPSTPTPLSGR